MLLRIFIGTIFIVASSHSFADDFSKQIECIHKMSLEYNDQNSGLSKPLERNFSSPVITIGTLHKKGGLFVYNKDKVHFYELPLVLTPQTKDKDNHNYITLMPEGGGEKIPYVYTTSKKRDGTLQIDSHYYLSKEAKEITEKRPVVIGTIMDTSGKKLENWNSILRSLIDLKLDRVLEGWNERDIEYENIAKFDWDLCRGIAVDLDYKIGKIDKIIEKNAAAYFKQKHSTEKKPETNKVVK